MKVGDLVKLKSLTLDDRLALIVGDRRIDDDAWDTPRANEPYIRVYWIKDKIFGVPLIKNLEIVSESR